MITLVRNSHEEILFTEHPKFTPNLTPREMFELGCFGGSYWSPIHSSVLGKSLSDQHLEYAEWWDGISPSKLTNTEYDINQNKYGVKSGTSLEYWESKNWIHPQDPYGWVQWYCRFFSGRRSEDDERQIQRWCNFAGRRGRFRRQLITKIISNEKDFDDESISPVIRQGLQQWAYRLTEHDFEQDASERWKKFI